MEVAKGYDCLLRLYLDKNVTLVQQYKAIKNGSYGLDTLYTKKAAINLAKLIILGHERKVKEILEIKNDDDCLKYYSGYTKFAIHAGTVISSSLLNSDLDSFYRFHMVMNSNDPVSQESREITPWSSIN
ncbi:putative lipopolysaccharide 1,2-glucosyltransferase RfaJ [Rickettsia amblyommatis str. Ac/Pa]|uniref:Putative lipopolysaccharide 1,2-glucosyltransferase RfaJ n=1 Tax=Rickettsia amblyommatis str. Ac/Pa TaxID=1359164 RepID=A0A0F3N676_RICAM|nr:putative lipopolysaccharide 1,2-glucosyltransferase RfaJ [Rickettsia amblyommatis str. Ac/Pa]